MQPLTSSQKDADHIVTRFASSCILPWCWILLCGTVSVLTFLVVGRAPETFNADVGSEAVLAKALITSRNYIVSPDFFYSTELQVVGHHLLLEIGIMLFPQNWMLARVFTLIVIMVLMVASLRFCAISLGVWERSRWIAGLLLLPFSIIYRDFYLYGMYYAIPLCVYFVGFGLCIRYRKPQVPSFVLLIAALTLGFAFGVSGFRMVLLCFLPLLFAFACACLTEASGSTLSERLANTTRPYIRSLRLAAIMALSSVIGTLINVFIISKMVSYAHWGAVGLQQIVPSKIIDFATAGFIQSWGSVEVGKAVSITGIASLCGSITCLIVVASLVACLRRWGNLTTAQQTYILFIMLSFFLSLSMYYLGNMQRPRYLTSTVIPFVLLVPIMLGSVQRDRLVRSLVSLGLACLLLIQATGYGFLPAIKHLKSGEPYDAEKVVAWLRNEGFSAGYASFWNCNNIVEISDGTLDIWCLADSGWPVTGYWWTLKPYEWLAEKRHSEEDPQGKVFLLVTDAECDQAKSVGIDMGEPTKTIGAYHIYTYESARKLHDAFKLTE